MEFGIPMSLVTPAGTLAINPTPSNTDGLYLSDVAGMDGGEVRANVAALPQRDGAYIFDAPRGAAYPTLTGFIRASTLASRATLMDNLRGYTDSIRKADGTLLFTPTGLAQRQLTVRLLAPVDIGNGGGVLKTFQLQLVAANPLAVVAAATTAGFGAIAAVGGSLVFPFGFPFTFGDNIAGTASVTPGGNTPAYPTVTVTGPITAPVIANVTTGLYISAPSLVLAAGDQLVIDMWNELVYVNATSNSKIGYVDWTVSSFWTLTNGVANSLRVSGSGTSGGTAATISFNDSYI